MNPLSLLRPKWRPVFQGILMASALSQIAAKGASRVEPFRAASAPQEPAGSVAAVQASETPGIMRPTDHSVLETGEVQIIARSGAEVLLDGQPVSITKSSLLPGGVLSLRLPAGRHELLWRSLTTQQRVQFFVAAPDNASGAPAGWKVYRAHPPLAECQTCHAVTGKKTEAFTKPQLSETCFTCHDQKAFVGAHAHNDEVLADCLLCHNPHGSSEKFHLKMPRDLACKQCHG